jgi:HEAT repeat protein
MSEPKEQAPPRRRRGLKGILWPSRRSWHWVLLRMAVVVGLLVAFRYHVLAWVAAGHNAAWKAAVGSATSHPGDVRFLLRLRGPGAAMLVRLGEAGALAKATDPRMVPVLVEMAGGHPDPQVRLHALGGLGNYQDDRTLAAAAAALTDPAHDVRLHAAHLLADRGAERHLPALRAALASEPRPEVQKALKETIRVLSTKPPAPDAPPPPDHVHHD